MHSNPFTKDIILNEILNHEEYTWIPGARNLVANANLVHGPSGLLANHKFVRGMVGKDSVKNYPSLARMNCSRLVLSPKPKNVST